MRQTYCHPEVILPVPFTFEETVAEKCLICITMPKVRWGNKKAGARKINRVRTGHFRQRKRINVSGFWCCFDLDYLPDIDALGKIENQEAVIWQLAKVGRVSSELPRWRFTLVSTSEVCANTELPKLSTCGKRLEFPAIARRLQSGTITRVRLNGFLTAEF